MEREMVGEKKKKKKQTLEHLNREKRCTTRKRLKYSFGYYLIVD